MHSSSVSSDSSSSESDEDMEEESVTHDLEEEDTIRATQILRARNEDEAINVGLFELKALY